MSEAPVTMIVSLHEVTGFGKILLSDSRPQQLRDRTSHFSWDDKRESRPNSHPTNKTATHNVQLITNLVVGE